MRVRLPTTSANKDVRFDLTGEHIDLANIPELQNAALAKCGASAGSPPKGSGTLEQPLDQCSRAGERPGAQRGPLGGLTADAVTHGSHLQLTARSNFPAASLAVDGGIELRGDMPSDLKLEFSGLDIDPFLPAQVRQPDHPSRFAGGTCRTDRAAESSPGC